MRRCYISVSILLVEFLDYTQANVVRSGVSGSTTTTRTHMPPSAFAAGNKQGFPNINIPNPFAAPPEPELTEEEKGKLFLESLELESSTEPRAFYTDPKRFTDIVTATMPVRKSCSCFVLRRRI